MIPKPCPTCSGKGKVSQPRRGWLGWKLSILRCPHCCGVGWIYFSGKVSEREH